MPLNQVLETGFSETGIRSVSGVKRKFLNKFQLAGA